MDNIIITCVFGKQFKIVHPSPDKERSVFFTNNQDLEIEITNKGWKYIYVNKPLTDDEITSSLQSKYIKFLQFLEEFPEFKEIKTIIYVDHKILVLPEALNDIRTLINDNSEKSLIINQTPSNKTNVYHEVEAAMGQHRYVKNMNKTKDFIKLMIDSNEISTNVRICSTGLLVYINRKNIEHLLNKVYEKCIEDEQPECQIYWSIFSQKYKHEIKETKWTDHKNVIRSDP